MNKYRNKITVVDGLKFHSKLEAKRYQELKLLERSGVISGLELQKQFNVIPIQKGERAATYKADFCYVENGNIVVEDTKGIKTPEYILKRKLMLFVHNIKIREISK